MFDRNKLRGKMAEHGCTATKLANILGINPATFHRKINGESEFTRVEIQQIAAALNLGMQDIQSIFFAD